MSRSRQVGTAAETAVVRYLATQWPHVERRALRGNNDRGDIAGIPSVVIEVKAAQRVTLASWLDELDIEINNDHADTGLVIARRRGTTNVARWYAMTTVERACTLLAEAGY